MRNRLRDESGLTLLEVLMTIVLITGAAMATLATFSQFSQAARKAQRHAVLVSLAQKEIEALRPLPYAQLGLTTTPSTTAPPLTGMAAGENVVLGGLVKPGGDIFAVRGTTGRVYRYVTWRRQTCDAVNAKVKTELSGVLGVDVSTAVGDLCPGANNTKRITVVVVPDPEGNESGTPVRLTTVAVDPQEATPAAVNYAGLKVSQAVAATTGGSSAPTQTLSTQVLNLFDTQCTASAHAPTTDHATRNTAQTNAGCTGANASDLMSLAAVPGAASDPLHDYATDVVRPKAGGLVLMPDDRAGACTDASAMAYDPPDASVRMRSLHTWASTPAAAAFETPTTSGRGTISVWTGTATGVAGPGRLCAVVRRAPTGEVLGAVDYALADWPGDPTQLTMAFDLAHAAFSAGERLSVTLRVPSDSASALRVLYDHPSYQSALSITTQVGKEFT